MTAQKPWKDFFDSLFKDKEISKPIANTLAVNLFYYRINYVCIWILLLIPFLYISYSIRRT